MAGYTDAAFRLMCARNGAALCFAEMVSADALSRDNAVTLRLLERAPGETLTGFQIFTSSATLAGAAVRRIAPLGPAIIDLNCGCSVPKVLKANCGAALLRTPSLIGTIVAAMKTETTIPISVKLRSGWDAGSLTYLECAEAAVNAGATLVTLHPRTRAQGFSGAAEWEHLRALKERCARYEDFIEQQLAMGLATSTPEELGWRRAYLAMFLLVLLFAEVPWAGLLLRG